MSEVETILSGHIDSIVESSLDHLTTLSEREDFERARDERDQLISLVTGAVTKEKIDTLAVEPLVSAARKSDDEWHVLVASYGKLIGTGVTSADNVRSLAESIAAGIGLEKPTRACEHASPEETCLIYDWLTHPTTRWLATPQRPLHTSVSSARRHRHIMSDTGR